MPNVLLTEKCVRSCPYCFAKNYMDGAPGKNIAWDDLIHVLDFLESGNLKQVSYLGGEPSIHPDFCDIVDYTLGRGFKCQVFTSGIIPSSKMDDLARRISRYPRDRLGFTCNINAPELNPVNEWEHISSFLKEFGPRVALGYNIYENEFDLGFLVDLVREFGLVKSVRLGLTHKMHGADNAHIPPKSYASVVSRIISFLPIFERNGVVGSFDCGYPICAFTDAQLGALVRADFKFQWGCSGAIDIGPDLRVWPCFPMSGFSQASLLEFSDMGQLNDYIHGLLRNNRKGSGIYAECETCSMPAKGLCTGGCYSYFS